MQLFSVILLIHYSKTKKKNFIVGFLDYEKAFDYANRAQIILKLINKGCGHIFTKAIAKMYNSTTYIPAANNKLCEGINTSYGVAQGRHSSPNLYSFYVSDMPQCTNELENEDFMDPFNLAQLADDSIVLAEDVSSFLEKMRCLLRYSRKIYQIPNISKTVFCHFSENPVLEPLLVDNETSLSSVNVKDGHRYLGMKCLPSNDMDRIIRFNLNERMINVCKFYAWLEVNEETPVEIKILVLDSCLFNSILYAVETWGDITCIELSLRRTEQKALKAILKVKSGTSNDLIYNELKRPDIISRIKDSQRNFFQRLQKMDDADAIVKSFVSLCQDIPFVDYYRSLPANSKTDNIKNREQKINESDNSMLQYYTSIIDVTSKSAIYSNFIDDRKRAVITRWRLSNHKLAIEIGRYKIPYVERNDRTCTLCNILEDEAHAIFFCPIFYGIRQKQKYTYVLKKYYTVRLILNPELPDIYVISELLSEIDDILNKR